MVSNQVSHKPGSFCLPMSHKKDTRRIRVKATTCILFYPILVSCFCFKYFAVLSIQNVYKLLIKWILIKKYKMLLFISFLLAEEIAQLGRLSKTRSRGYKTFFMLNHRSGPKFINPPGHELVHND